MDKAVQDKANAILKEEATAALLPFPYVEEREETEEWGYRLYTQCPKCAGRTSDYCYRAETESAPEYMKWTCHCGYTFKTKPGDA